MEHSAIITHKLGFNVEVYVNFLTDKIEMHRLGSNQYYKGNLQAYTDFQGNMQDFVNAYNFN